MTPDRAALARLLEAATPGPWFFETATVEGPDGSFPVPVVGSHTVPTGVLWPMTPGKDLDDPTVQANGKLVAAAVNALPALLAALAAREGEVEGLKQERDALRKALLSYRGVLNEDEAVPCKGEQGGVWLDVTWQTIQELVDEADAALGE